ncbi:MAG: outer membrane protein [Hyphomicrobiaceae bacterium]
MNILRKGTAWFGGLLSLVVFTDIAAAQEPDWIRPYVGAQIGYTTNHIDASGPHAAILESLNEIDGVIGGIHGGSNFFKSGNFIFGLVADFNWTNANERATSATSSILSQTQTETRTITDDICGPVDRGGSDDDFKYEECGEVERTVEVTTTETTTTRTVRDIAADIEWKASIRTKAGLLLQPNLLAYVTSGIAFAKVEIRGSSTEIVSSSATPLSTITTQFSSEDEVLTGLVVGGGLETLITQNLSAFVQALHYRFNNETINILGSSHNIDLQETTVTAGLSFHFN